MEDGSTGDLVPSVKWELKRASSDELPAEYVAGQSEPTDKELLCPICMQIIKDAFLTSCGHSFCYMCIITHLDNKSDCPCCASSLTTNQLYPNFLLDKVYSFAPNLNFFLMNYNDIIYYKFLLIIEYLNWIY